MFVEAFFAAALLAPEVREERFSREEWAAVCPFQSKWQTPGPPMRLHGNAYHVGSCGILAVLLVGDQGHVLIDSGTEESAGIILENIRRLGLDPKDVKYLLHTQEHFDHVGGHAALREATGAKLLASPVAAEAFETGHPAKADPQWGYHGTFAKAPVDGYVLGGQMLTLGNIQLLPVATPGHSAGALSWVWKSCEEECAMTVFTAGMGLIKHESYSVTDHPAYLSQLRQSIDWIKGADVQICLLPHPEPSLYERIGNGSLIDPEECRLYAKDIGEAVEKKVKAEMETGE